MRKKQLIEDALLSGQSLDELIKIKMKEEIKTVFEKTGKLSAKTTSVTDLKEVPKEIIFSKKAVFKKFNKSNNTISFINGIQAEALLGQDNSSRERLLNAEIEVFSTDNAFVKFEYAEITDRN